MPTPAERGVPASVLQEIAYATHDEVYNKNKPIQADLQDMPLKAFFESVKEYRPYSGGKTIVKMVQASDQTIDYPTRRGTRPASEINIDLEMEFSGTRIHMATEFVHDDLEDIGFTITPAVPGPKSFGGMPKADMDRLVNLLREKIEATKDKFDTEVDLLLHLDGTQDSLATPGLDGLLPIANTSGTIGGQPRTNPIFQHHVTTGSTVTSGGTLERDLQQLIRDAQRFNRDGFRTKIDYLIAGEDWVDGYISYARANNMDYQRNGGDKAVSRVDIGLPDSAIHFNGIPVLVDPTFRDLDSTYSPAVPWQKRCYGLSRKAWKLGHRAWKKAGPLVQADPAVPVSRMDIESWMGLICLKPNGNFVNSIA